MYTGIDIGGTKCAVINADDNGKIIAKEKFPTTSLDETLKNIFDTIDKMGCGKAVGISCGGSLSSKTGVILSPPNLPGWDNVEIVKMIQDRYGVPARLCNDANACALAEWKFGAGKNTENMIFLTFGTGMGAGLILNGRLYEGASDMAGEIGHVRLENYGPVGYGKQGSVEGFCSGGGIAQLGRAYALSRLQMGESVSFCENINDINNITAKSIAEKADEGNDDAKNVYTLCGKKLGQALSILIDILNPEMIVIGSIYERSENLLKESMIKELNNESLYLSRNVCKIKSAALGDSIGDMAAIAIAMNI